MKVIYVVFIFMFVKKSEKYDLRYNPVNFVAKKK